jgi:Protein of unknown function (DUF4013)
MNYSASVTDFFKCPAWKNNMLLGAVAVLIPIVGPLVLFGWHITCLWARGNKEDPADFPAFNFDNFVKYLERGLWPFLVNLVASLVLVPVILVLEIVPLLLLLSNRSQDPNTALLIVVAGLFFIIYLIVLAMFGLVSTPLLLRAIITQDFKAAFDPRFAKTFISMMWKEILTMMVFMLGLSLCMMVITVITCYIGMFFATPVFMFSWHHLQKQLYQLYLSRGGEAVPLSPKLNDLPPPLHA